MWSSSLHKTWPYAVYIPAHYDPARRYPVILVLHGMDGDYTNFFQLVDSKTILDTEIAQKGTPALVVFVDGGNDFYINSPAAAMDTAITQDLMGQLQKQFALAAGADQHVVGGVSMGGYGAMSLAFRHPDVFHAAFGISPAVWRTVPAAAQARMPAFLTNGQWDQARWNAAFPLNLVTPALVRRQPAVYLASAKPDTTVPVADVTSFAAALRARGLTPTVALADSGGHNVAYWRQALPQAYAWSLDQLKK